MKDEIKENFLEELKEDKDFRRKVKSAIEDSEEENRRETDQGISRRSFLKRAGLGAASLGAASLVPSASGLSIETEKDLDVNDNFSLDQSGNIDMSGGNIQNSGKVEADNINDSWLKPEENTIQAIQDLVDNHSNPHIRLKPGEMYEGDTQLYLDSTVKDDEGVTQHGKVIHIDARGAGVNYTGDEDEAVMIQQGNLLPSEPDISDDANDDMAGTIKVKGGTWWGPGRSKSGTGSDTNGTAVFRQRPSIHVECLPSGLKDAQHGILVEWYNGWNEGCHWGVVNGNGYAGDSAPNNKGPQYLVRLAGSGSPIATPEWTAGQGGRSSGRESKVTIDFASATNVTGSSLSESATLYHDHVAMHGGHIHLTGFIPQGGTHYKLRGNLYLNETCTFKFECENGDSDSTAIDIGDNTHQPTFLGQPRVDSNGKVLEATGNAGMSFMAPGRVVQLRDDKKANLKLRGSSIGNRRTWLEYEDDDGFRYGLGDNGDGLALVTNGSNPVWVIDDQGTRRSMKAEDFKAGGSNTEERSFKGKFDEHPSAENGDTWYITGTGSPEEGAYIQTSSGKVKLG